MSITRIQIKTIIINQNRLLSYYQQSCLYAYTDFSTIQPEKQYCFA